jgi:hypothetical protein
MATAQQNAAHPGLAHGHRVAGWPMPVARALGAVTVPVAGTVAWWEAAAR